MDPRTATTGAVPAVTEAALRNRNSSFVIDGEAVLLGVDGRSDFNGLHSRKHNDEAQFYAFDILAARNLRKLPLSMRKANLARLLARRTEGAFIAPSEQGGIGHTPDGLFIFTLGGVLLLEAPSEGPWLATSTPAGLGPLSLRSCVALLVAWLQPRAGSVLRAAVCPLLNRHPWTIV